MNRHIFGMLFVAIIGLGCKQPRSTTDQIAKQEVRPDSEAYWKKMVSKKIAYGVSSHYTSETADGSTVELFLVRFDLNKKLRFHMYDQDQDDAVPFDNQTDFWDQNVAYVARKFNKKWRVIFACNGLFHGYDRSPGSPQNGFANHIGLNVIDGVVRYNYGSPRWAFGAKNSSSGPEFGAFLSPSKNEIGKLFDNGAVGAQLLTRDGVAQNLPDRNSLVAQPTGEGDVGGIPTIDYLKTSRISFAWQPGGRLWILVVNEEDNELESKLKKKGRMEGPDSGWDIEDLQRYWMRGEPEDVTSVNIDGGMVAQWISLREDGNYDFQPPRWIAGPEKIVLKPDLSGAPKGGGTLMSFVITEDR